MAKKQPVKKMSATAEAKGTKPVRLELDTEGHDRLERNAKACGLSKSSYVRMALFERMKADEGRPKG